MRRHILRIRFECQNEKTTSTAQETKEQIVGDGEEAGVKHRERPDGGSKKEKDGKKQIMGVLLWLSCTAVCVWFMQINVAVSIYDMATMLLLCRLRLSTPSDRYRAIIIEHFQPICPVSCCKNCQPPHLNDSSSITPWNIEQNCSFTSLWHTCTLAVAHRLLFWIPPSALWAWLNSSKWIQ